MDRNIDIGYLDKKNFWIGSWLRQQGWKKLCSLEVNIYPDLIREFFENINFEGESSVESIVKGVHISLDERKLGLLLQVPRTRICYLNLPNKSEALKCILERKNVDENQ